MNNLDTFGKRLAHARKTRKLTQREVAKKAGIEQGTLSGLETEKSPSTASAVPLARALRVRIEWLIDGEGDMDLDAYIPTVDTSTSITQFDENVAPVPKRKRIPIISWVQAGAWTESNVTDELTEHDKWMEYTGKWKPCLYALEIVGDSMISDDPVYNFAEGGLIVCDPEQTPTSGQFCIAKNILTQQTTFKRFDSDGFNSFLTALNKEYPRIHIDNDNIRIIARVTDYVPRSIKL